MKGEIFLSGTSHLPKENPQMRIYYTYIVKMLEIVKANRKPAHSQITFSMK